MEEQNSDVKRFFKRLTVKEIVMVLVVIGIAIGLGVLLHIYNQNKISKFTLKPIIKKSNMKNPLGSMKNFLKITKIISYMAEP